MRLLRSLLCLAVAAPLAAQQARATRDAEVRAAPDGNVVATVESGTTWRTGTARGGFTRVTLEGWIEASRLAGRRDTFPASIGGSGTWRLRAEPSMNGRILGVFEAGAGLRVLERRGNWARVRRDGWIPTAAIASSTANAPSAPGARAPESRAPATARPRAEATERPAAPAADAGSQAPDASEAPVPGGALRATAALPLRAAPGARAIGELADGAIVDPVARDRGWVRVRVEAWVPESLLVPADSSFAARLTAADLRLDPEGYRGRTVRWEVQVVSLQTADPLRRALNPDEPYLLAMGPAGENALLYLAVPPNLLEEARRLPALAEVRITARVRNGRSQPTGAPVLDLLTINRK